jgi:hypothetical protein
VAKYSFIYVSFYVVGQVFVVNFNGTFYFHMAANVDWASSAEEQEKLITEVVDVKL